MRIATALRKLAEAGQGLENISEDVHRFDQFKEIIRAESLTWAESVANYFWLDPNGRWIELRELPCEVPTNWLGGYFIFGIEEGECRATFSRTLPAGLDNASVTALTSSNIPVEQTRVDVAAIRRNNPPNVVVCKCGATIAAANRKIALQELREHKRLIHGLKPHPSQKKLNRGPRRPE